MTRDEFIEGYVTRSRIAEHRTAEGYDLCGHSTVALPCACGEEGCEGWAMVPADSVRWHLFQNSNRADAAPMTPHTAEEGVAMARAFMAERDRR